MLVYAIKSMDSHHLRSVISICLLTSYPLSDQEINEITSISDRIHSVKISKSEEEFVKYSKKRHLQIFEFNRTRSSSIIERYEYCCKCNYKYDRITNKFVTNGCEEIKYISFAPFLKISDIFEFKSSIDDYSFPDMQKDYKYFWGLYKSGEFGSEKRWKDLCSLLSTQNETNKFEIKNLGEENNKKTYLIEKACLDSIKKLCVQIRNAKESISCNIESFNFISFGICCLLTSLLLFLFNIENIILI